MAKVVFFGSPGFAVPSLRALNDNYEVVGVVTQPDARSGRGRKLGESSVKRVARELGLSVITPTDLGDEETIEQLSLWRSDVFIVAAFGKMFDSDVLELPVFGCLNVHASLLPRHRGAAPVAAGIWAGDSETGITLMEMDEGLETGPILQQRTIPIQRGHTGGSLMEELSYVGSKLLIDALPEFLAGKMASRPQDHTAATYAPRLKKSDGHLDFGQPAEYLSRQVRALDPWPGAFALRGGVRIKVLQAGVVIGEAVPGRVVLYKGCPAVGTCEGLLKLDLIQASGGRPMSAVDYMRGSPDFISGTLD